jgi:SCY1-like protein 1
MAHVKDIRACWMQTRHPRVLTFEWSGETTVSGDTVLYLVTEPVSPLATLLEELGLDADQRLVYLALGLRQAAQAVAFLNNQCKMMHGNICMRTLLATPELDWKLGFLDMVSEHAHLTSSLLARWEP